MNKKPLIILFTFLLFFGNALAKNKENDININLDKSVTKYELDSESIQPIKSYADTKKGQDFINMQAGKDYSREELTNIFQKVYRNDKILAKIARPAEKSKPWYEYRNIFLDDNRIKNGVDFYNINEKVLQEAYEKYGVNPEIIVAIIGVETRYGKVMGSDKVIDALSTIGFDYPARETFFTKELIAFLKLSKQDNLDIFSVKGSYAGAMGMAQFMPSSFMAYAVSYNNDAKIDIWNNPNDAIFSIANYLSKNGWKKDENIVDEAYLVKTYKDKFNHKPFTTLGYLASKGVFLKHIHDFDHAKVGIMNLEGESESLFYITFNNFAVITTYNTSKMYALAVYELSQKILSARR